MKNKRTRILAIAGIVLLLALYAATMIFALMDSPTAKGLFMGSLFCTFAIPILLYAMILVARTVRGRGVKDEDESAVKDAAADDDADSTV